MHYSRRIWVLLAGIIVLFTSCRDVQEPEFKDVENLKLGKLDFTTTIVSANIRFNNPNGFNLQLKSIDCDVYVDSAFLGHFINTEAIRIPARQEFILPVKGDVATSKLISYSSKAFLQVPSLVRVEGKARVGRGGFFKTVPFNYTDTVVLKL